MVAGFFIFTPPRKSGFNIHAANMGTSINDRLFGFDAFIAYNCQLDAADLPQKHNARPEQPMAQIMQLDELGNSAMLIIVSAALVYIILIQRILG